MRKVIFHYHFFKNAGTSLDSEFKKNISKKQWVTQEFPGAIESNRAQVADWVTREKNAIVFSSHTAHLPVPKIEGVQCLPVLFIRHPVDRIASIYTFERKQGTDNFGAVLARNTSLAGYIECRLALVRDRLCRDFHAHRLCLNYHPIEGDEQVRAHKALAELPFVGVVDRFDESMEKLESWLRTEGFAMQLKAVRKNVSRNLDESLDERLAQIKSEIGAKLYRQLLDANAEDMELYRRACEKL
ncbi:sulfotransferase family 2 domain-containing protein [Gilvimarinus agarilyticus]|uniref:sulfotransferase family 2 domain-containing protein n=1 Tax=Gilvimarinus sp. 2_MG-2023 TaxID=3062666 RepID=UPI001C085567|nr:sulfotransferase family 2 domain-containing protein [Gilvimarinus sp. 2_MG-2023]MBU2886905.1 sulfotransferase family 2 domain-containing protein [Gilvimarinus agarilyticus]MDO6571566.1 sulfotransferase family 2 domain-containing protein [Gilvimarinus sp. 2_MG-2023]